MLTFPAEVHADLDCDLDGRNLSIRSSGNQTSVEVPDVATGLRLVRLGSPRGHFIPALHHWKRLLDVTTHRIDLPCSWACRGIDGAWYWQSRMENTWSSIDGTADCDDSIRSCSLLEKRKNLMNPERASSVILDV